MQKDKNQKNISKVTMSNLLIQSKITMSIDAQKLLYIGIAKLKEKEELFQQELFISVKEFMELTNTSDKKIYKRLDKATDELFSSIIEERKGKYFVKISWVTKIEYSNFGGLLGVRLKINDALKPYIIDLKNNFTNLNLLSLVELRSKYAVRLYSILKSECWKNIYEISIDDLKFFLGLSEDQYPDFYQLKRGVLNLAVDEINLRSELNITYKPVKINKKVSSLIFHIKAKNNPILVDSILVKKPFTREILSEELKLLNYSNKLENDSYPDSLNEESIAQLSTLGLELTKVKQLVKDYTSDYLLFVLANIPGLNKKTNPAGYFLSMLDKQELKNQFFEATSSQLTEASLEEERLGYEKKKQEVLENFNQNGEQLKKEFFTKYPEVFTRYIYKNINRQYSITTSGYPFHPTWSAKPEDKEQNIEMAKYIYQKFSNCKSLRDFTNLIKYDESWIFEAFINFQEYSKGDSKEVRKDLSKVAVPFEFSNSKDDKKITKNLSKLDIDIANIVDKFKV